MVNALQFPPEICFDFPLSQPSLGAKIGNGTLDISVWGDERLCLSIARIGFGCEKDAPIQINGFGDEDYPVCYANLELRFADAARPVSGILQADGKLQITFDDARILALECAMDEGICWLEGAGDAQWELLPVHSDHYAAPLEIRIDDGRGWIWEGASNDSLATMVRARAQILFISTAVGETEDAAKAAVSLARGKPDINPIYYWKQYWRTIPRILWDDASLQKVWDGVLFTQARTNATAVSPIDLTDTFINLLVGERGDGIHIFPANPLDFHAISFDNVRCNGGFILGAKFDNGAITEARVQSENGGILRLHPNAETYAEREMSAGEVWNWQAE